MQTTIHIQTVLNGWVVTAGCQTIVYNNAHELTADLAEWLLDPAKAQKRILAGACNRKTTIEGPPMTAQAEAPMNTAGPMTATGLGNVVANPPATPGRGW